MIQHPKTGKIWLHEHGPQGGDEINVLESGANYGWPEVTYGEEYGGGSISAQTSGSAYTDPLYYWVPSIAPSGFAYVDSPRYADWQGSLLVGSLKFGYLERLELNNGQVVRREKQLDGIGRVRDVRQLDDGFIYVAVEGVGIVRLEAMN